MEAILKFNLENPDDRIEHLAAIKSGNMRSALFDISHNLRKQIENEIDDNPGKYTYSYEVLDLTFEKIHEILKEYHVLEIID